MEKWTGYKYTYKEFDVIVNYCVAPGCRIGSRAEEVCAQNLEEGTSTNLGGKSTKRKLQSH